VRRAENLTTFTCLFSWYLRASTTWNTQGLSRSVLGLLYLYLYHTNNTWRTCKTQKTTFNRRNRSSLLLVQFAMIATLAVTISQAGKLWNMFWHTLDMLLVLRTYIITWRNRGFYVAISCAREVVTVRTEYSMRYKWRIIYYS